MIPLLSYLITLCLLVKLLKGKTDGNQLPPVFVKD